MRVTNLHPVHVKGTVSNDKSMAAVSYLSILKSQLWRAWIIESSWNTVSSRTLRL